MAAPRQRVDEVLAHPVLQPGHVQLVATAVDDDGAGHLADPVPRDPPGLGLGVHREAAADRGDPAAEAAGQPRAERLRARQQRGDVPGAVRAEPEFDVVHLAHHPAVRIDDLVVEQPQPQIEPLAIHHCPAAVRIIRGIAAAPATPITISPTVPSTLASPPLTCLPMYTGSLATTRMGK